MSSEPAPKRFKQSMLSFVALPARSKLTAAVGKTDTDTKPQGGDGIVEQPAPKKHPPKRNEISKGKQAVQRSQEVLEGEEGSQPHTTVVTPRELDNSNGDESLSAAMDWTADTSMASRPQAGPTDSGVEAGALVTGTRAGPTALDDDAGGGGGEAAPSNNDTDGATRVIAREDDVVAVTRKGEDSGGTASVPVLPLGQHFNQICLFCFWLHAVVI
jgi:hypothetical protein